MIQNIVFDMGGVLVNTDHHIYYDRYGVDPADRSILERAIFHSVEWLQLDRGVVTKDAVAKAVVSRLPAHLKAAAEGLFCDWHTVIAPMPGMETLIRGLKAAGYRIYVLSNTADSYHSFIKLLPVSALFDGAFISADCHLLKPDLAIYRAFFERFSLAPASCVFIDDNAANVEASIYAGMPALLFTGDVAALREALRGAGISFDSASATIPSQLR